MYDITDSPDNGFKIPEWALIVIIIILSIAFVGAAFADDTELQPGGVEVRVNDAGEPMFLVDVFAIDWKAVSGTKWYSKPGAITKQLASNTVQNVKTSPWLWLGGTVAALAATGALDPIVEDVTDLFGGGSDDDKKNPTPQPTQDRPAVVVQGDGNQVTTTQDDSLLVTGNGNVVNVEPYPNSGDY